MLNWLNKIKEDKKYYARLHKLETSFENKYFFILKNKVHLYTK
jgi:hypothetical protein